MRRGHDVTVVHSADAFSLRSAAPAVPIEDPPGLHRVSIRSGFGALAPVIVQQTGRPGLLRPALRRVLDAPCDVVHFHNVSLIGGPGVFPMSRAPVTLHTPHDHWLFCATHVLWKNGERPCDTRTCLFGGLAEHIYGGTTWGSGLSSFVALVLSRWRVGARTCHLACARRRAGARQTKAFRLYAGLLAYPLRRSPIRRPVLPVALLAWSQLVNAFGYLLEKFRWRR